MRSARSLLLMLWMTAGGCGAPAQDPDGGGGPSDAGPYDAGPACGVGIAIPSEAESVREVADCAVSLEVASPRVLDVWAAGASVALDGRRGAGPRVVGTGSHAISVAGAGTLHVRDLGAPAGAIRRERSLAWTDPAIADDPRAIGLSRLMRVASGGAHGGLLLDQWFRRFGTTPHSERLGPQQILEDFAAAHGTDPRAWDLDALPFRVTAIHNRIDLQDGTHCGELRVSLASIDPVRSPFHLIFLFRQAAQRGDAGEGAAHCAATALRWARLSDMDSADFLAEARAWLDEALVSERLLVLETVEFIISPWEWRQWFLQDNEDPATQGSLPRVLDNRPLFQTVDIEGLNRSSATREAFLRFVEANAGALASRRALIPEAFRASSARVNDGVPWIPLDLSGVDPAVLSRYPTLRQQIELVGCPACHATDARFVQTLPDRSFSPFYDKELDARALHLRALSEGTAPPPPFGPLQAEPVLPP